MKGRSNMHKNNPQMLCLAKYIAGGMVIGSAIGTAAAVMMKSKKPQHRKKPECLREKAASAMDTVATVMQNLADMAR